VQTAQVLASVTSPTYSLRMLAENPEAAWGDPILQRHVDRVLGRPYQPGSTIKPLVYLAAVMEGEFEIDEIIDCKGHFYPDKPNQFRDWIFKQYGKSFGPLNAPWAMAHSSNYFFYTLGSKLGSERLVQWFERFGL